MSDRHSPFRCPSCGAEVTTEKCGICGIGSDTATDRTEVLEMSYDPDHVFDAFGLTEDERELIRSDERVDGKP